MRMSAKGRLTVHPVSCGNRQQWVVSCPFPILPGCDANPQKRSLLSEATTPDTALISALPLVAQSALHRRLHRHRRGGHYRSTWLDIAARRDARADERSGLPVLVMVVVVMVVLFVEVALVNLSADLARRERGIRRRPGCRVDIGIGGIGFERLHKRVEVASHNVLPRDRENVGACPHATHGAAGRWAFRGGGGPYRRSQVRAEEHQDAAGIARLTKMDVSLRHHSRFRWRGAYVRIGQRPGGCEGLLIEIEV